MLLSVVSKQEEDEHVEEEEDREEDSDDDEEEEEEDYEEEEEGQKPPKKSRASAFILDDAGKNRQARVKLLLWQGFSHVQQAILFFNGRVEKLKKADCIAHGSLA